MNLNDLPITGRGEVLPDWIDEMGHMNVMWYTHLFSRAVFGFFDLFGFTPEYMQTHAAGSFALELHVRYLAEVRVGQKVTLRTRVLGRTAKRMHYMQFLIIDGSEKLSATGELVSAHVDMKVRRQSPLPEALTAKLDPLIAAHAKLDWAAPVCGTMGP
ncbi:MAG: thioesterase family protein [Planctomycetia bacterium]|nr:thioesterase family protein [Planctomycetia bacterium]